VNLTKYLTTKGFKIKILDNLSVGKLENLSNAGCQINEADIVTGDILDQAAIRKALQGTDTVVHMAAHTGIMQSLENPQENWRTNVNGILNLLENCRKQNVERFVFASSNAALGQQVPPYDENKIPKPLSPYGASKLASEALCAAYFNSYSLKTVSLRFSNCYGPYSAHKTSVVTKFMGRIKQGKPITVYGDGRQSRDFIHVNDICQAIYICLATDRAIGGDIFQIAHGTETTITELVTLLKQVTKMPVDIVSEPKRKGDIERNFSDISKAKDILGFKPDIDLPAGLEEVWQWYQAHN
jgi:UDP-glucose 4-epimerase